MKNYILILGITFLTSFGLAKLKISGQKKPILQG